jgi:hypothetical protein
MTNEQKMMAILTNNDVCIKDLNSHGFSGGVSGFIYYNELKRIYNDNEDTFENWYNNNDDVLKYCLDTINTDGLQSLYQNLVWFALESIAQNAEGSLCECEGCKTDRGEPQNYDDEDNEDEETSEG